MATEERREVTLEEKIEGLRQVARPWLVPADMLERAEARVRQGHEEHGNDVATLELREEKLDELADVAGYTACQAALETCGEDDLEALGLVGLAWEVLRGKKRDAVMRELLLARARENSRLLFLLENAPRVTIEVAPERPGRMKLVFRDGGCRIGRPEELVEDIDAAMEAEAGGEGRRSKAGD